MKGSRYMEVIPYLIFIFIALWLWLNKSPESKLIEEKEERAKNRLRRFFDKLSDEENTYRLVLKVNSLFYNGNWKPISKDEFELKVIEDCVRPTGVSRSVSDARFSVSINHKSKIIYCVIGDNNFKFTQFHNKQRQ
jgi:hypothetical protein